MSVINYVNLSNGIEALPYLQRDSVRFMRLQSTSCEQKHWAEILDGLPDGFLLDVAAGCRVIVHDRSCSNRAGGLSRAQWQGIEWVRYALARSGLGATTDAGHVQACQGYWRECWASMPRSTVGRLRWFSRWVRGDYVWIQCAGGIAKHDGDSVWHRAAWSAWLCGGVP